MKKLTKREKLLIYILGCFLVGFFGIYFVVLPSFKSYQVVSDQVAEAQFTQESMAMAIDGIPSTMQARDDATSNLAVIKAPFSPKLANEGLDILLTQLCLGHSLSPKILAIESNGMAGVASFTAYTSDQQPSASIGGAETTTDGTSSTTQETESATGTATTESTNSAASTGTTETPTGVVTMELTGTQANFYRLLDTVSARPDMIISAFTIAPEAATTGSVSALTGGNITINVTFTVYMV